MNRKFFISNRRPPRSSRPASVNVPSRAKSFDLWFTYLRVRNIPLIYLEVPPGISKKMFFEIFWNSLFFPWNFHEISHGVSWNLWFSIIFYSMKISGKNLDKIIKSVINLAGFRRKFINILTWKFLYPLQSNRLNFPVIAFMKIHGNILENSRIFKAPWRKCYMVIERNSPGTFFSGI